MFFRKSAICESIKVGRSYTQRRTDNTVEVAQVLGITPDGYGIPHVRYELTVEKPMSHQVYMAGTKVLSLIAFRETFPTLYA